MEKKEAQEEEQVPLEGVVVGHELLENGGTKLILVVGEMKSVPRDVKVIW